MLFAARGVRSPVVKVDRVTGDEVIIRIDDEGIPEFWATLTLTIDEVADLLKQCLQSPRGNANATEAAFRNQCPPASRS